MKLNENTEVTAAEAVQADPQTLPVPPETPETAPVETALVAEESAAAEPAPGAEETAPEAAPVAEEDRTTFDSIGLSEEIVKAVTETGYRHPTPIQEQAIPQVLMGRDVLGCAQTGTGKTASFVLPMLDILTGSRAKARMPRSLILEPTRELALQVAENFDLVAPKPGIAEQAGQ